MTPRPTHAGPPSSRSYSTATRPTATGAGLLQVLLRGAARRTFRSSSRRHKANAQGEAGGAQGGAKAQAEAEPQSLGARLRKLSREYGWVAVGVYAVLTVADFPICFLIVRVVGTEKIGAFEHAVVSRAKAVIPQSVQDFWHEYREAFRQSRRESRAANGEPAGPDAIEMATWDVQEAAEANQVGASLGTQLALAYAIHKTIFIFVRVPLTAILTPKVAKVLRGWGWQIGKRRPAA